MSDSTPRASLLDIQEHRAPVTTLVLSGELDPATAPTLAAALAAVGADEQVVQVVVDLAALSFLDSSGLRVFVAARQDLLAQDRALVLRNPSDNVRRLLDVTGLAELITVE